MFLWPMGNNIKLGGRKSSGMPDILTDKGFVGKVKRKIAFLSGVIGKSSAYRTYLK
jgi:hypothetical protein